VVDPVDYQLVLKHPDRDEPETSDFMGFEGEVEVGQVLRLASRGHRPITRASSPQLICAPA
jgi:hypothetical protein